MMFTDIHNYGTRHRRLEAVNLLRIPNGNVLPDVSDPDLGPGCVFYLTTDDGVYSFNGTSWDLQFGGTGNQGSYIILGDATWSGTGLVFDVSPTNYSILGTTYSALPTQVTLAPADPTNPRIDVIYLNDLESVGVLTGTPGVAPVKPQIDPSSEIELSFVLVAAGATTPSGITNEVVYDENTESTGASDITGANFAYATAPFNGSVSALFGTFTAGKYFSFLLPSPLLTSDYGFLKFYLKLGATFTSTTFLSLYFFNGATQISTPLNILSGQFGFTRTVVGTWQTITIPVSSIGLSSNNFDKILFRTNGSNATGFGIDLLHLQAGNNSTGGTGVNSFNLRTGNVIPATGDYSTAMVGDTTNKRYVTDADLVILGNTSKVNSGDEILDYANFAAFPVSGVGGLLYRAIDTNVYYKWTGAVYSVFGAGASNWGDLGGTLSAQTDLQSALDLKADLVAGLVPSSQLPSYVDDVLEYADLASFPVTGTASIIYIALDTNNTYRWTGATYVQVGGSSVAAASETVAGITEFATQGETNTGTDDTRAVTPLKLITNIDASTTARFADSTNKRYVTDADLVKLGNTSGTNTGDDILVYADLASFPVTGVSGLIYYAAATDAYYKWDGAAYAVFGAGGGGGGTWGSITGTLSAQTDLQTELDDKADNVLSAGYAAAAGVVAIGDALEVALEKLAGNAAASDIIINQKILSIAGNYSQSIM